MPKRLNLEMFRDENGYSERGEQRRTRRRIRLSRGQTRQQLRSRESTVRMHKRKGRQPRGCRPKSRSLVPAKSTRVSALAMRRDVEALALMLLRNAQPDHDLHDVEADERHDCGPDHDQADGLRLDPQLRCRCRGSPSTP